MTTIQKIEELNKACDGTLSITSHTEWSIYSYGDNTPLDMGKKYPFISSSNFEDLVNKAYKFVFKK
jgi:hypothetical protein